MVCPTREAGNDATTSLNNTSRRPSSCLRPYWTLLFKHFPAFLHIRFEWASQLIEQTICPSIKDETHATSPLTPLFGPMCCSAIPRKFCSGVFPPAQRHTAVMSWEHSYAISKLKKGFCSDVCFCDLAELVRSPSSPRLLNAHHFLCCVNVSSTNCINSGFCFMFCGVVTHGMWQKI